MAFRVLQLISSAGFYGAENVVLELSSGLEELGSDVTVGTFKNRQNPNLELYDKARELGLKSEIFECKGKVDFRAVAHISSFVRDNSVDIVHCHGYKSNVYAYLANIWNRKPLVSSCHNWLNGDSKMSAYNYFDKLLLKRFNAVISVSAAGGEILKEVGVARERIHVIENGINIKRFAGPFDTSKLRAGFAPDAKSRIIGTVGRLTNEKGHTYLLNAAKKILAKEDCVFMIVGAGALGDKLESEARELGIGDRVIFTGKRPDIPELLSVMDVFVLPSVMEAQPMALLEAMAARKPIVATTVGDIPMMLKNGKAGVLIPPADAGAISDAVLTLLKDASMSRSLAEAAYKEVNDNYSSRRMAEEYVKVYELLAAGNQ